MRLLLALVFTLSMISLSFAEITGSIKIHPIQRTPFVTLTIDAHDDLSGIRGMCVSNGMDECTAWQPYHTTLEWVLPSGTGWKIVCVRFSDVAGNESNPVCDAVWLEER